MFLTSLTPHWDEKKRQNLTRVRVWIFGRLAGSMNLMGLLQRPTQQLIQVKIIILRFSHLIHIYEKI